MKTLRFLLFFLGAIAFATLAHATNKSITTVSAAASTILSPSDSCTIIVIKNTGSGNVRLGLDGGTTNRQKSTPDPTASLGYLLEAGDFLIITRPGRSGATTTPVPAIRAILTSGTTTTLEISTDDPYST